MPPARATLADKKAAGKDGGVVAGSVGGSIVRFAELAGVGHRLLLDAGLEEPFA